MRTQLIAFLCTVALFLSFGVYLLIDHQGGSQTDGETEVAAQPSSAAGAGAGPEVTGNAAEPLNAILKCAAMDDWTCVERTLGALRASATVPGDAEHPRSAAAEEGKRAIDDMKYEVAIRTLSTAVTDDPDDALALNYLAFALVRTGRPEEAYPYVARSLTLAPAPGATWANAAEILAERDNEVASLAALKVAIHLSQDRNKTLSFLTRADQTVPSPKFRAVIFEGLTDFAQVPPAIQPTADLRSSR
jgi:tetratricopeptide (TPR) repeat protein